MAKADVNRLVRETMRKETASLEIPLRELVEVTVLIATADRAVEAANAERSRLIALAQTKLEECKAAGWRVKALAETGIVIPKPITLGLVDVVASGSGETETA